MHTISDVDVALGKRGEGVAHGCNFTLPRSCRIICVLLTHLFLCHFASINLPSLAVFLVVLYQAVSAVTLPSDMLCGKCRCLAMLT